MADQRKRGRKSQRDLAREGLILDVTESIYKHLNRKKMSKVDLANALGCGKSHVTQLLNGGRNITLRTLSDLAEALNCDVQVRIKIRRPVGD